MPIVCLQVCVPVPAVCPGRAGDLGPHRLPAEHLLQPQGDHEPQGHHGRRDPQLPPPLPAVHPAQPDRGRGTHRQGGAGVLRPPPAQPALQRGAVTHLHADCKQWGHAGSQW